MERLAFEELWRWRASTRRKPLLVRGARQVGKSWLINEFGRQAYRRVVSVNFDETAAARDVFAQDLDVKRILAGLALLDGGGPVKPSDSLIFLDEIQSCPQALASLKYFAERAPEYHVIGAGSLLGVALHEDTSFPVGKVDFLDLHPMTFGEFLTANGRADLAQAIQDDLATASALHSVYVDLLRQYYYVGGMPEAVATFLETQDPAAVRRVQQQILDGYDRDFSKHAPGADVPKLRDIYQSLPAQLGRVDKKFRYGLARAGARGREYESALRWLEDTGLTKRLFRITAPRLPLRAYEDRAAFKLYGTDVGLLAAQSGLDAATLVEPSRTFTEFKGALTEQYVIQQMLATGRLDPHYWSADAGAAEVDIVIRHGQRVVPVEVKAETNLKAKSLRVYRDRYAPEVTLRISMSRFHRGTDLIDLPLYAVEGLEDLLGA